MFRALTFREQFYYNTLFTYRSNTHSLCSISFSPLLLPDFNKKSNDFCTFFYTVLFLSNYLPNTACSVPTNMSFRRNLKTYLFNQAFPILAVFPIRNHLRLLSVLCTLAI